MITYSLIAICLSIIYGIVDILVSKSHSHLTLWTWFLHCIVYLIRHIYQYKYEYQCQFTDTYHVPNLLLAASIIGSFCVFLCYIFVLILNPGLEHDLNNKKCMTYIWIRSITLHLLPVILSIFQLVSLWTNIITTKGKIRLWQQLSMYLLIPIAHMITGLIVKYRTGRDDYNAYNIYINYKGSKSNRFQISEIVFILGNLIIMLFTITGIAIYLY